MTRMYPANIFLLEISPPECKLTDLNSKNGVFVNGIRYGGKKTPPPGIQQAPNGVKEVQLKDGDEIMVGDTRIQIIIHSFPLPATPNIAASNIPTNIPNIPGYQIEQKDRPGEDGHSV